ncbi:hypothetical protein WA158_008110 [Blastocystis sp. Blastoise]
MPDSDLSSTVVNTTSTTTEPTIPSSIPTTDTTIPSSSASTIPSPIHDVTDTTLPFSFSSTIEPTILPSSSTTTEPAIPSSTSIIDPATNSISNSVSISTSEPPASSSSSFFRLPSVAKYVKKFISPFRIKSSVTKKVIVPLQKRERTFGKKDPFSASNDGLLKIKSYKNGDGNLGNFSNRDSLPEKESRVDDGEGIHHSFSGFTPDSFLDKSAASCDQSQKNRILLRPVNPHNVIPSNIFGKGITFPNGCTNPGKQKEGILSRTKYSRKTGIVNSVGPQEFLPIKRSMESECTNQSKNKYPESKFDGFYDENNIFKSSLYFKNCLSSYKRNCEDKLNMNTYKSNRNNNDVQNE